MIREAIAAAIDHQSLTPHMAREAMREIMEGEATPAQIAAFISVMRMKGETVDEIAAFASEMRRKAVKIHPHLSGRIIDTGGTGGDGLNTFNISTVSMFVAAGAGVPVAKHGNRSVSSSCGSADVLEFLGARMDLKPMEVEAMMETVGICFMFAPVFHPAMKHALGPRRELGLRTFFNILGPLTNPCEAKGQVLGVYDVSLVEKVAHVLLKLGVERAYIVHGEDGQDEISITGGTLVAEVKGREADVYTIRPADLGMKRGSLNDLKGGNVETNSKILVGVLSGFDTGVRRDAVVVNAAAAIAAAGLSDDLAEAVPLAKEAIDSGNSLRGLLRFLRANGGETAMMEELLEECA